MSKALIFRPAALFADVKDAVVAGNMDIEEDPDDYRIVVAND